MAYRKYFDIDPDFFPAVNNEIISKNPELWKKFYPHETFIRLVKQLVSVLERKQKLNIWVEGAYGTGKSYAVLTLKKLLDASPEETEGYFNQFHLDEDLRNKFLSVKNQGKIITVHRWGSSSIHSDNDLFFTMQESIEDALKEAGIENAGPNALKNGIIAYLSDKENKQSFEIYVKGSYSDLFGGEDVNTIIKHLQEYTDQALQTLMNKIFKVANEKRIKAFSIDEVIMCNWIKEVIQANHLKAIVFIWDEFTEYFSNNAHRLSGFQEILHLSQTEPFCFIPVTHRSDAGLNDSDSDKKKILDRFIKPTCIIDLPENMAFQLMGEALQKKEDPVLRKEWENDILPDLEERTHDSRKRIKDIAGINDKELRGILPIHPYAACLLKHISVSYESNQRSMFDFIKNSGNEEQFGFQWFIDKFDPLDNNPFLTIDLLWGFFYDMGKNNLSHPIRQILDRYQNLSKQMNEEEQKVLKAILLFQAMSQSAGDTVELFLPNEKNLNYAFEGSDFDNGAAARCAEKLVRDKVIYKKNFKDGTFLYSVHTGEIDADQIDKKKPEFEDRTTGALIKEGQLAGYIELPPELNLRYKVEYAGVTDFDQIARKAINNAAEDHRHFYAVVTVSKDTAESIALTKKIKAMMETHADNEVIIIDCSKSPLGKEEFAKWVEFKATSSYYSGKDNNQATTYNNYANQVLATWRSNLRQGQFVLYTKSNPNGSNITNIDSLVEELTGIDSKRFPLALECHFKSIAPWWMANSLQVGAECGATGILKGTYNNKNANLANALGEAWTGGKYWETSPATPISRIKIKVEKLIQDTLKEDGRIAITTIYDMLQEEPYGFLPSNMTAFFMGFLLKEYVNDKYSWSDGLSSDELSLDKFKEMVSEVISLDLTPNNRYRTKYIVTQTPEEKAFNEGTATAFGIPKTYCSSIESARDRIRSKMKENLAYPVWALKNILGEESLQTDVNVIAEIIDAYHELANNNTDKSDSDIAISIGKKFLQNDKAATELQGLFNEEKCKEGMLKYLGSYNSGELIQLAKEVDDKGQFINELKNKFDAEAANWVWKKQTVNQKIEEVILEYKIIIETSKLLGSCVKFKEAIAKWIEICGNLRLAYQTIKNDVANVHPLLELLVHIKTQGSVQEEKKEMFLQYIQGYGTAFNNFYQNQSGVFKKSCDFYLSELSDSDKEKVFKKMPSGCFTMDHVSYCKRVEDTVNEYKKELGSIKLKALWKEKTGTDNPLGWSKRYKMPIIIMVPDDEIQECRSIFNIVNSHNPSDKEITKALAYLEHAKFWDALNDKAEREKAFRNKILGDKSVMLPDTDRVKDYLSEAITDEPFYWQENPTVPAKLEQLAQAEYTKKGYGIAIEKIDGMAPEAVKKYLKELIKNNMNVGIQIIKNN